MYYYWRIPDLIYYMFFGSLNTKIEVIYQRNWGFTLIFVKTTLKRVFFYIFALLGLRFTSYGFFGSLIKNFDFFVIKN